MNACQNAVRQALQHSLDGQIAEHDDLAIQVEHGVGAPGKELDQHVSILRRGPEDILRGPIVEDKLKSEGPGRPTLLLRPGGLDVGDLADLNLTLGAGSW